MSRYRRADIAGATYFFTVVTYRRRSILCDEPVREALRSAITTVRARHPFTIDAWVLLPDHLHSTAGMQEVYPQGHKEQCSTHGHKEQLPSIWTLPPGDANYSLRWGLIKRSLSLSCTARYHRADWMSASKLKHREATIWQRRYWEHCIRDETDFSRHVDYIYFNPVKHGLVQRTVDWPFATFHRDVALGLFPAEWGMPQNMELPFVGEPS